MLLRARVTFAYRKLEIGSYVNIDKYLFFINKIKIK